MVARNPRAGPKATQHKGKDMTKTVHNPDQYMSDLRQILAQGRKRLAILVGAGAPLSIQGPGEKPLIPDIAGLTSRAISALNEPRRVVVNGLEKEIAKQLGVEKPNIEQILSRVRSLGDVLGETKKLDMDGKGYGELSTAICKQIGKIVNVQLPEGETSYAELAGWIGGMQRNHPFEVFTPNYDLLFEEALERAHVPYFDGFTGAREPFFDPATIANGDLPPRWARLWKLHGSLGWGRNDQDEIVRGKGRGDLELIYPTYLKYGQTQKLPYFAFIERLRAFLNEPDSLLMTSGFSFADSHLYDVIDESLAGNPANAVIAFQYQTIDKEDAASRMAERHANMSVYARDQAIINCIKAPWQVGELPNPGWKPIRESFWGVISESEAPAFFLGDFSKFARYLALTRADQVSEEQAMSEPHGHVSGEGLA